MLTTDFNGLFKHITDNVYTYLMFLTLIALLYLFFVASVRVITDALIRIVIAFRTPIVVTRINEPAQVSENVD